MILNIKKFERLGRRLEIFFTPKKTSTRNLLGLPIVLLFSKGVRSTKLDGFQQRLAEERYDFEMQEKKTKKRISILINSAPFQLYRDVLRLAVLASTSILGYPIIRFSSCTDLSVSVSVEIISDQSYRRSFPFHLSLSLVLPSFVCLSSARLFLVRHFRTRYPISCRGNEAKKLRRRRSIEKF